MSAESPENTSYTSGGKAAEGASSSSAASSAANTKQSALLSAKRHTQQRRLSLGVGPRQASGSHVLQVSPPGMEEMDASGATLMIDDSERPMTRVEIMHMIKSNGDSEVKSLSMNGGHKRSRR